MAESALTTIEGGMELDWVGILAELAQDRPIFHSEPDFQHALAWQVRLRHPQAKMRLEPRPRPGFTWTCSYGRGSGARRSS
jgi:hypothetical protein